MKIISLHNALNGHFINLSASNITAILGEEFRILKSAALAPIKAKTMVCTNKNTYFVSENSDKVYLLMKS